MPITATSGEGVEQLVARAVQIAQTQCDRKDPTAFQKKLSVLQIGEMGSAYATYRTPLAISQGITERDGQLLEKLKLSQGVFDKLERS